MGRHWRTGVSSLLFILPVAVCFGIARRGGGTLPSTHHNHNGKRDQSFSTVDSTEGMQGAVTTVTCKQRNKKSSLKCRKIRRKIAYYEQMPYSKLTCCCELKGKVSFFLLFTYNRQYSSTYVVEVTSICGSGTHQAVIGPCPCISPPNAKGEVIDGQHFHVWSAFQSSQHFSVSDTHILISFYIL